MLSAEEALRAPIGARVSNERQNRTVRSFAAINPGAESGQVDDAFGRVGVLAEEERGGADGAHEHTTAFVGDLGG